MTIKKIVVISDEHSYRRNPEVTQHAADNHGDAHYLIRLGDLLEMGENSPFPGPYPTMNVIDEYNLTLDHTAELCRMFPQTVQYLVAGNHGARLRKALQRMGPAAAQLGSNLDLLDRIRKGERIVQIDDPQSPHMKPWGFKKAVDFGTRVRYTPGHMSHVLRVGRQTIFIHASKSFKLSSSMARLWFFDHILTRWPDARVVFQAHTHRQAIHSHGSYRYVETGCACFPGGYEDKEGKSTWAPIHNGYAVCLYDTILGAVVPGSINLVDLGCRSNFNPSVVR